MPINYPMMILGLTLVILGMFLHELIHLLTLKIMGYNGKFVFIKKHLGMGIKPLGLHENIIDARNAILFLLAPLPFTVVLFMFCFMLIGQGIHDSINISVGLLTGLLSCGMDIKQSMGIYRTWIKK